MRRGRVLGPSMRAKSSMRLQSVQSSERLTFHPMRHSLSMRHHSPFTLTLVRSSLIDGSNEGEVTNHKAQLAQSRGTNHSLNGGVDSFDRARSVDLVLFLTRKALYFKSIVHSHGRPIYHPVGKVALFALSRSKMKHGGCGQTRTRSTTPSSCGTRRAWIQWLCSSRSRSGFRPLSVVRLRLITLAA